MNAESLDNIPEPSNEEMDWEAISNATGDYYQPIIKVFQKFPAGTYISVEDFLKDESVKELLMKKSDEHEQTDWYLAKRLFFMFKTPINKKLGTAESLFRIHQEAHGDDFPSYRYNISKMKEHIKMEMVPLRSEEWDEAIKQAGKWYRVLELARKDRRGIVAYETLQQDRIIKEINEGPLIVSKIAKIRKSLKDKLHPSGFGVITVTFRGVEYLKIVKKIKS